MIRRTLGAVVGLLCMAAAPALAQAPPAGTVRYYHTDALGSVRAVTDAAGNVVARHDYFPFGDEPGSAPDRAAQRFTGAERDPESTMDYFQARYYMQRLGRFTSSDPEHIGGNPGDPQSWNAYAYARNNPFRYSDSTGTDYLVNIEGGSAFWFVGSSVGEFQQLQAFAAGFSLRGGVIYNSMDVKVGTYMYVDPSVHMAWDIAARTGAVVEGVGVGVAVAQVALGAFSPGASAAANCVVGSCSVTAVGMAAMGSPAAMEKWVASRTLRNILKSWNRRGKGIGTGNLPDAIRYEIETGLKVGGKTHMTKGLETRQALLKLFRDGRLDPRDRAIVKEMLIELQSALSTPRR